METCYSYDNAMIVIQKCGNRVNESFLNATREFLENVTYVREGYADGYRYQTGAIQAKQVLD